jgi:hypothetical protein
MAQTTLIKKGTTIYICEIESGEWTQYTDFEIVVGDDILQSDDDYEEYNGTLVVSEEEVDDAIYYYMQERYPDVYDYTIDIEDN